MIYIGDIYRANPADAAPCHVSHPTTPSPLRAK